jgi:hypothetical protein
MSYIKLITGDLYLFSFPIAMSTVKALDLDTSGPAVCISVCLRSLAPYTYNNWLEHAFHILRMLWDMQADQPSYPLLS